MSTSEMLVLAVGNGGIVSYDKETHSSMIENFLVYNREGGGFLLIVGVSFELITHSDLRSRYRGLSDSSSEGRLVGAGKCIIDKKITNWESEAFGVNTPQELRPAIAEVLGLTY